MSHDRLMPEVGKNPAHPWRMSTRLQSNSAPRHLAEGLFHRFRVGCDPLLQNHPACSIENTVETRSITQIEPDGQLPIMQFSSPTYSLCASLLHCRSPCLVRLERVDNLGAYRIPPAERVNEFETGSVR